MRKTPTVDIAWCGEPAPIEASAWPGTGRSPGGRGRRSGTRAGARRDACAPRSLAAASDGCRRVMGFSGRCSPLRRVREAPRPPPERRPLGVPPARFLHTAESQAAAPPLGPWHRAHRHSPLFPRGLTPTPHPRRRTSRRAVRVGAGPPRRPGGAPSPPRLRAAGDCSRRRRADGAGLGSGPGSQARRRPMGGHTSSPSTQQRACSPIPRPGHLRF